MTGSCIHNYSVFGVFHSLLLKPIYGASVSLMIFGIEASLMVFFRIIEVFVQKNLVLPYFGPFYNIVFIFPALSLAVAERP